MIPSNRTCPKSYVRDYIVEYTQKTGDYQFDMLDIGCRDGDLLISLGHNFANANFYGVDLNPKHPLEKIPKNISIKSINKTESLVQRFQEKRFDFISLVGVLEHIYDQSRILREISSLLKPDGIVLIVVPRKYLLSCLDLGNLKFRFPLIHKWLVTYYRGNEYYYRKYVSNEYGCIGDIETEKKWHQHFSERDIKILLLDNSLAITDSKKFGFFYRLIIPFEILASNIFFLKPLKSICGHLISLDMKYTNSGELLCVAKSIYQSKTDCSI